MILIKNWQFIRDPISLEIFLQGMVYGHHKIKDGKIIKSSIVVGINGKNIKTRSGSIYVLTGDPNKEYEGWLINNGFSIESQLNLIRGEKIINNLQN